MRLARLALPLLLWLALLAGCARQEADHAPAFHNTDISGADYGRDFSLLDHTGRPRRLGDYRGKAVVIFFGYTQCPDVCPTTLSTMAEVMKQLGDSARRVQVLFITLDPQRDTRELLATYVPQFDPSFVGLYGDAVATAATAKEFRVFYEKRAGAAPMAYSIDHSANSFVFDPQGRLRLFVKYGEAPENIAADLRLLLAGQ